jgi:hypothetical protein
MAEPRVAQRMTGLPAEVEIELGVEENPGTTSPSGELGAVRLGDKSEAEPLCGRIIGSEQG